MNILITKSDCEIVSNRILNFEIEKVYKAFSMPNHLMKWWGPDGFSNTFNTFEFEEGGKWSFVMHGPDKGNYVNECQFIKIIPNKLIAWKRFSAPLFQMLIQLEKIENRKTNLTFKMLFYDASTCAKLKAFVPEKNEENFNRLALELLNIA